MQEKRPVDRRKYVRFGFENKVNFQIKQKAEKAAPAESISGIAKNISVEGICFASEMQLEPGTRLELEILIPAESKPLHLGGEVRWSRPVQQEQAKQMFDTGVRLFTIDKSDESRFMRYVCDKMAERLNQYLHL